MPKRNAPSKPPAPKSGPDAPQSHMRIRPPNDPLIEELYSRFQAGEITIDEAIEQMKAASLSMVKGNLADAEYADLEEFMRNMEVPHVDKLRRSK